MEKRQLGKSCVKITPILLGTSAIGGWNWGGSHQQDDIQTLQASIDNGVTTIDTAPIYGIGLSEKLVGQAIKGRRKDVVIATKCGLRWDSNEGSDPWPQKDLQGNSIVTRKNSKPQSIIDECEQSLKRLEIDVIDLYQIHWPDSTTSIEESWSAMVKLKKQGKVRAIGVSNYNLEQLRQAHALHPIDSIQLSYSLVKRDVEENILPFCIANNIGLIAYSPMERGLLSGKVSLDHKFSPDDQRAFLQAFSKENRQRILKALENLKPLVQKYDATYAQLVINSVLNTKGITGTIVGARNALQAIENANARRLKLTDMELNQIKNTLTPSLLRT